MSHIRQLYQLFAPQQYDLHIIHRRMKRQFEGTVTITGTLREQATAITVHTKQLIIVSASVDDQSVTWQEHGDELSLLSNSSWPPGEYKLDIVFSGTITDSMQGLYPSYFTLGTTSEELLTTQFESHSAREVFPCIDEPAAKATFNVTLTTEIGETVLANMPIKQQSQSEQLLTTTFETTPIMSTYLLAWVTGKLAFTETRTKSGVVVRAYATPDQVQKTSFALAIAARTIEFFDDYFDLAYPLPKCDLVALPDFSAGAMENWGCITFRESCMLVDKHTSESMRQYVVKVVTHEIAHQWFGNLVTMQWWNDLWLNESFASWAEHLATEQLFPEWQTWVQFYDTKISRALERDGLAHVQSVRQDILDPEEIHTLFDPAIVYAKGASLLHMLHTTMGANAFREGLRIYMKRHQYANTTADDLWKALSEASGEAVAAFMHPWLTQPGHPVLTVGIEGQRAVLHQRRFYSNPNQGHQHEPTMWPVPLFAGTREVLHEPSTSMLLNKQSSPVLCNQGRAGFYITAYDEQQLQRLSESVAAGSMPVLERLGLLGDAYDLTRGGLQSVTQLLQLLEAYRAEAHETVWRTIAKLIMGLRMLTNNDPALEPLLRSYVWQLVQPQCERLGWKPVDGEISNDVLLRSAIIDLACYSEHSVVIAQAQQFFAAAKQPESIPSDVRANTFALVNKLGDADVFTQLLLWHQQTNSAQLRRELAFGLSATQQPAHIQQLLAMLSTKEIKPQDFFTWFVPLLHNHQARLATWQWMQDNWQWIERTFGGDFLFSNFPTYTADAFSTKAELEAYRRFFSPLVAKPALERPIKQGLEGIEARVLWRERDLDTFADYLRLSLNIL